MFDVFFLGILNQCERQRKRENDTSFSSMTRVQDKREGEN